MFSITYIPLALVMVAAMAIANPANLQNLYGTPSVGDNSHQHHHSVNEIHSDHAHESSSIGSEALQGSSTVSHSADNHDSLINSAGTADNVFIAPGAGESTSNELGFGSVSNSINDGVQSDRFNAETAFSSGGVSSGSLNNAGRFVTGDASGLSDSSSQNGNSNLRPSINSVDFSSVDGSFGSDFQADITITRVVTEDVFTTLANIFYNTIPVTLTQFMKTTAVAPTFQVISTAVDDKVFVATAPVTRTDTVTVLDTHTAHKFATEVSTDIYTITHSAFNIQQQVVTSTVIQTQVFRPTVVSTRIDTEYDTQTVVQTVTNTVVVGSGNSFSGSTPDRLSVPRSGSRFEQRLHQDVQNNRLNGNSIVGHRYI